MNPALINYLQSVNSSPNGQGMSTQGVMSQGGSSPAEVKNPFDTGIKKAISAARESLGMTQEQQDRSLRNSLLAFGAQMSQEPVQRGFFNNLGAVARSMNPAIAAYDTSEDAAITENNKLAKQILDYQAAEKKYADQVAHQNWQRGHAENQLGEQRRYHDLMGGNREEEMEHRRNQLEEQKRYHDMMAKRYNPGGIGGMGATSVEGNINSNDYLPIQTKKEVDNYSKDKSNLGTALHGLNMLEKMYDKFRDEYKDNVFDTMSYYNKAINPIKEVVGNVTGNQGLRDETSDRLTLQSKIDKFVSSAERSLKGGGVLGPTIIKYFDDKKLYPHLSHDMPQVFKSKLNEIREELEANYKAANLSLKYGLKIDPSQVREFEEALNSQNSQEGVPLEENTSNDFGFIEE